MLLALVLATAAPSASEQAAALFWQACAGGGQVKAASASETPLSKMPDRLKSRFTTATKLEAWTFPDMIGKPLLIVANYDPAESGIVERCTVFSSKAAGEELSGRIYARHVKTAYVAPDPQAETTAQLAFNNSERGWVILVSEFAGGAVAEVSQLNTAAPSFRRDFEHIAYGRDDRWKPWE